MIIGYRRKGSLPRNSCEHVYGPAVSSVVLRYLSPKASFLLTSHLKRGKFLLYAHVWSDISGVLFKQQILERLKFDLRLGVESEWKKQAANFTVDGRGSYEIMLVRLVPLDRFSYTYVGNKRNSRLWFHQAQKLSTIRGYINSRQRAFERL